MFWDGVDELSRANDRLYTEVESALPTELTLEQNIELIRGYAVTIANPPDGRVPFEFGVHYKAGNPHVHCVFSARVDDGFERDRETWFKRTAKSPKRPLNAGARSWSEVADKAWIKSVRANWADHVNDALERVGSAERIDHRSHADRGLAFLPTRHEGIDGRQSPRARAHNEAVREINKLNAELAAVKHELVEAGVTRGDYRQFRKQHPSDAKRLRDERRDRSEADELRVTVAQLAAARQVIAPATPAAAEAMPGLVGLELQPIRLPLDHLRPAFIIKNMASGPVLYIRMPVDKLAFVERETAIRLQPGYDLEAIRAALQVGAARFGRMKLTGPMDFQRAALAEAHELGMLDQIQSFSELANEYITTAAASATLRPAVQTNQELLDQLKKDSEDTKQQRTADRSHVPLDQVDATLPLMTTKEIELRRQAPAELATQRAVFEAHSKAVRERVAELERCETLESLVALNQNLAVAGEAAAVLRQQWRAGFDRLQVSRKQATIADREAAVVAAKKKVELIVATVVPPVGLFGGKAKQEANDVAVAKRAERLWRAERVRDAAQASLDEGWSEIDDKLEQNRAAAAAAEKAARKDRAVELTQLRAQIEAFPKEAATLAAAVDRERIAEVRDRAIAEAAKPVTDEEKPAAAERLRIRRLADGHTPG